MAMRVVIHKEGLAMEAFSKFSFKLQLMVKILLLVLKMKSGKKVIVKLGRK